jgi:hypothetical protein
MALKTHYESDFYRIQVDKERKLLLAKWLRPVTTEEIILGGTKLYHILQETQLERASANAQALTTLSIEAKEWLSTTFYQLLSQTNLKKLARVLPDTLFYKLALESVVTRAEALGNTKFEVRNFASDQEALAWLLAQG